MHNSGASRRGIECAHLFGSLKIESDVRNAAPSGDRLGPCGSLCRRQRTIHQFDERLPSRERRI